ncbi:hypothetical protein KKB40_05740 [Patescibacteria group bacterium]|nr:hypothetical protein [Patescibacteria group bacterium]
MKRKLLLLFFVAFVLRLGLIFTAYHGDLNNNISWGTVAVEEGLNGFYGSSDADDPPSYFDLTQDYGEASWPYSAPNQPPLTILMFAGLRVVWQTVENVSWWLNDNFKIFPSGFIWFWESKGMMLLVKLPGILADLGIGFLIYKYLLGSRHPERAGRAEGFQKRRDSSTSLRMTKTRFFDFAQNDKKALLILSVWLFNPVVWYNSAIWGQTDSIVNLLGLVAVLFILRKDLIKFSVFFTLAFLFKGSLGIFIPVLGMIAIWQKHSLKNWIHATCYMLLTTVFISYWFHPKLDLFVWLFDLYKNRILPGEIGYLTANAFNFWWLVDSGRVLDSTLYLGLSARIWGILILITGITLFLFWLKLKKITDKKVFISLAVTSLISFLFMTRIHERYMYPFFPFATVLLGFMPQMTIPYVILSITHLLNLYHLFWAPPITFIEASFLTPLFAQAISLINIFVFLYLLRSAHQRH